MKTSTCYLFIALSAFGQFGGVAKMSWIYKELQRERKDSGQNSLLSAMDDFQVPQYYRFNQHYTLALNF